MRRAITNIKDFREHLYNIHPEWEEGLDFLPDDIKIDGLVGREESFLTIFYLLEDQKEYYITTFLDNLRHEFDIRYSYKETEKECVELDNDVFHVEITFDQVINTYDLQFYFVSLKDC